MPDTYAAPRRPLEWWERRRLEKQSCSASEWEDILIDPDADLDAIRNVRFRGSVSIGKGCSLAHTTLENITLGDNVEIADTPMVRFDPESRCGVGTEVDVLDETGSRPVTIYPGLSAQTAFLMAREPRWAENHLKPALSEWLMSYSAPAVIGNNSRIIGSGWIENVSIGREISVIGARSLKNGSILNNAAPGRGIAFVGAGVDAENFIIEDGCLDSAAIIRNCYIGQGVYVEKGFSAHDSLFFANCSMENGEACALFAGPYTVSMHKASLLIGCETSFMNAGSGTNQSNHMYKLGPVHWGVLERGVKTSSSSYLMLGAKIGAFSLLMGQHKTHPDSSQFPFSYLFGDDRGATVVVPAIMLRNCGLLRDEKKWPTRDRRLKRHLPLHDRIIFDVLNPLTVDRMLSASEVIDSLLAKPADDDRFVRYRGMKFSRASLERARTLYELAIFKYLSAHVGEAFPEPVADAQISDWVDVAGLIMPRHILQKAMESTSFDLLEESFSQAFDNYRDLERDWIAARFPARWRRHPDVIRDYAAAFDAMVEEDRTRYLDDLEAQNRMLAL